MLTILLLFLAVLCFALAAANAPIKANLIGLGLCFWAFTEFLAALP